jgi:drug/metabolite transporter (DMT)-like permease
MTPERKAPEPQSHPATTPAQHLRAVGMLAGAAALWSLGGLLIKSVQWNPLAIAGGRSLIALPVLLLASRKKHLDGSPSQIAGAVAYCLTVVLFVSANKFTTAANAILLQYMAPVYVALLSHFFLGERVKPMDWMTIAVALGGMALFFLDRLNGRGLFGNVLAILAGVAFAFLVVFMRRQKHGSPLGSVILGNVMTGVIGIPFMFHPPADAVSWTALLLLGVFQIGFSYLLYAAAIRHATALEGILVPVIEPVLNPIWVFLFLGESPGRWAFIGGSVVISIVLARSIVSLREKTPG